MSAAAAAAAPHGHASAGDEHRNGNGADAGTSTHRSATGTTKQRYRTVIPAPSGNYAFIKTIGQGSMGKVKLAKKEGTNDLASHPIKYATSRLFRSLANSYLCFIVFRLPARSSKEYRPTMADSRGKNVKSPMPLEKTATPAKRLSSAS